MDVSAKDIIALSLPFGRGEEYRYADAVLAALKEAGYVVVPKEATDEMIRHAVPPLERREAISVIYAAMIDARPS